MGDLYDQLEELEGMTQVLTCDVERLRSRLPSHDIQATVNGEEEAILRLYVRAVFALIEALVEQHKQILLQLVDRKKITLAPGVCEALSERVYVVKDNGTVAEREQYITLQRKLRAVCRAAGEGFGEALVVDFGGCDWESFRAAVAVRDRLTHPKTLEDCEVDEEDLKEVDRAESWYRGLHNEFVRVARSHRVIHGW
jgi:hypothetical protein